MESEDIQDPGVKIGDVGVVDVLLSAVQCSWKMVHTTKITSIMFIGI